MNFQYAVLLPTDSFLTRDKLAQLLRSADWGYGGLHRWLDICDSVYKTYAKQYQEESDLVEPLIDWYLSHHPAPSWVHVATALYNMERHELLKALRDHVSQLQGTGPYTKGHSSSNTIIVLKSCGVICTIHKLPCVSWKGGR